ncbi:hypothetical protein ABPG74_012429 [Tetrahymena malaccensis]
MVPRDQRTGNKRGGREASENKTAIFFDQKAAAFYNLCLQNILKDAEESSSHGILIISYEYKLMYFKSGSEQSHLIKNALPILQRRMAYFCILIRVLASKTYTKCSTPPKS